jgi:hypothetical protein
LVEFTTVEQNEMKLMNLVEERTRFGRLSGAADDLQLPGGALHRHPCGHPLQQRE